MLSDKLYIYVYTHIHIYISLQMSIWLLKNTDCFTTIAPLTFIIIHSNSLIHTVVEEIGTPALSKYLDFWFHRDVCALVNMAHGWGDEKRGGSKKESWWIRFFFKYV